MRFAEINISDLLEISREEWEKMVYNRLPNRFATKYYSDNLLKKIAKFIQRLCAVCEKSLFAKSKQSCRIAI